MGVAALRPLQQQAVAAALQGQDLFVLLTTGGGKSLCYQLPALVQGGLTVVVSPLLALMRDQISALQAKGVACAALNSTLSAQERQRVLEALPALCLLYLSPETLLQPRTLDVLRRTSVQRLVIDEAHCIDAWGFDFRPEYLELAKARRALGNPPLTAVTATATPETLQAIIQALNLRDPRILQNPTVRENLSFQVVKLPDSDSKFEALLEQCRLAAATVIIYCATRAGTVQVATRLQGAGLKASAYHALLPSSDKRALEHALRKGSLDILCATSAFGMGIDIPHIGSVLHLDVPSSLEAYYQEAGRAGRDGNPAACTLLYSEKDIERTLQRTLRQGASLLDLKKLYLFLRNKGGPVSLAGLELARLPESMFILEQQGVLRRTRAKGGVTLELQQGYDKQLPAFNPGWLEPSRKRREQRLQAVLAYLHPKGCRQLRLSSYFGHPNPKLTACRCDVCQNTHFLPASLRAKLAKPASFNAKTLRPLAHWCKAEGYLQYQSLLGVNYHYRCTDLGKSALEQA